MHRKIMDAPFYRDSEAVHLWFHLLMSANHKDGKYLLGNQMVEIPRGSLMTGRKSLSRQTGVSESKIQRLLKVFETEQQIEQRTFTKYRLITILNYEAYQSSEQQNEPQVNSRRTASEQQVNTNNNVNNENNDNKDQETPCATSRYRYEDDDMRLATLMKREVKKVVPTLQVRNMALWANDIRLSRERDGRTRSELHKIFVWANKDEFWQMNILSPSKLRKHFDTLVAKSNKGKTSSHTGLNDKNYEEGIDGFKTDK